VPVIDTQRSFAYFENCSPATCQSHHKNQVSTIQHFIVDPSKCERITSTIIPFRTMGKKQGSARKKGRNCSGGNRGTGSGTATTTTTTTKTTTPSVKTAISLPTKTLTKKERDTIIRRMYKQYGGRTDYDVVMGSQRLIASVFDALPHHIREALHLFTKLEECKKLLSTLPIDEQIMMCATLSPKDISTVLRGQQQLQDFYTEYNLSRDDMLNFYIEISRDVCAYCMMADSLMKPRSAIHDQRIVRASSYIVDAMLCWEDDSTTALEKRRCLVVGCGIGDAIVALTTLSSSLVAVDNKTVGNTGTFIQPSQIYGIDISGEMIKHAKELHPHSHFVHGDILKYDPSTGSHSTDCENAETDILTEGNDDQYFDGIIFCSSLEDKESTHRVLEKAVSLLRPSCRGTIVLVDTTGAGESKGRYCEFPSSLMRLLPTAKDLLTFVDEYNAKQSRQLADATTDTTMVLATSTTLVHLSVEPADADTPQDKSEGYLAVLSVEKSNSNSYS
jgi:SAM-dependent methyltransferase